MRPLYYKESTAIWYISVAILVVGVLSLLLIVRATNDKASPLPLKSLLVDFEDTGVTHIRVCRDITKKETCVLIGEFKRLPIEDAREFPLYFGEYE